MKEDALCALWALYDKINEQENQMGVREYAVEVKLVRSASPSGHDVQ